MQMSYQTAENMFSKTLEQISFEKIRNKIMQISETSHSFIPHIFLPH